MAGHPDGARPFLHSGVGVLRQVSSIAWVIQLVIRRIAPKRQRPQLSDFTKCLVLIFNDPCTELPHVWKLRGVAAADGIAAAMQALASLFGTLRWR